MIGIAEAVALTVLAEKALTDHERTEFYKKDPWSTTDAITVKITDLTDVGDIRYHVKGVDTRFNRISYQEMKCMPEDELRKIMEDYEE